jgi:hypothetical protein
MTKTRTKPLSESKDSFSPPLATQVALRPENRPGCPVTARALEIIGCWAAHGGADALDGRDAGDDAAVIEMYRRTLEDMVAFERAGSIGGALYQIVLAASELEALVGNLPDSVQAQIWREETKIGRLLESAAAAIIAETEPAQLADVMPAIAVYFRPDLSPAWRWRRRWPEYVAAGQANGADAPAAPTDRADGARHA